MDEKTLERIEQLASETVIKISNMAYPGTKDDSKAAQRELTRLRLSESVKMTRYFTKMYETFEALADKPE